MVDFELGEEQRELLNAADRFARKELYPLAQRMDDEEWWPEGIFAKIGDAGLLGITVESALGGVGADLFTSGLVLQGFARHNHALALSWVAHENLCLNNIHRHASAAQRERFVPGLCKGTLVGGLALTEPGAGSDALGSMRTTARRDGDDYVLNGTKLYITNGVNADLYFVAAKTGEGRHAMSMFIVEKGTPGFTVGRQLDKGGWRSSDTAELVFDDVRIPVGNLLGEENRGFYSVMKNFQTERIALGAMAIGHCMQALKVTLEYVRDRRAFGATLFDKQVVRQKIAMLDAKVRAARSFMYHCAWRVTQGHDVVQEVSMLKALTGELVNEVVQGCQQFHGGSGYMRGTVIERLWRDARVLAIGGGATEVMLDEVAKRY